MASSSLASTWEYFTDLHEHIKQSGDERVNDWFLVKSPIPIVIFFVLYMALVYYGPRLMATRAAFQLKYSLLVYNAFQISLSTYMFYEFFMSAYLAGYDLSCQPVDTSMNPLALRMTRVCWWFFFSKIIDLMDTVFLVLRKKNNQLSFLHVYHHSTMIFNWWIGVKYAPGGQAFFCGMLNSLVHSVMYSYYLLSSLGPKVQPYLWWKRYLTQFQMCQFVLIAVHLSIGHYNQCDFPPILEYVVIFYCMTLIIFFANFYIKQYISKVSVHKTKKA